MKRATTLSVLLCLSLVSASPAFSQVGPHLRSRITPFDRSGVHHVSVRGRLIDSSGNAVPDSRLLLVSGSIRLLPVAETRSDARGRFEFPDVNSSGSLGIVVDPPMHLMPGAVSVDAVSGADSDVGDIFLRPNTTIRVALEVHGNELSSREFVSVRLDGSASNDPRVVATRDGEEYVLDRITFQEGTLVVNIFGQGVSEVYSAPIRVQPGRVDRFLRVRIQRNIKGGVLEFFEGSIPPRVAAVYTLSGRLRTPSGDPVEGAFVAEHDALLSPEKSTFAKTGPGGQFKLLAQGSCVNPDIWCYCHRSSGTLTTTERSAPIAAFRIRLSGRSNCS